jgi:hypothetical protein
LKLEHCGKVLQRLNGLQLTHLLFEGEVDGGDLFSLCTTLTTLELKTDLMAEQLTADFTHLPSLKSLSLSNTSPVNSMCFRSSSPSFPPNLQSLDLVQVKSTPLTLPLLPRHLTVLRVTMPGVTMDVGDLPNTLLSLDLEIFSSIDVTKLPSSLQFFRWTNGTASSSKLVFPANLRYLSLTNITQELRLSELPKGLKFLEVMEMPLDLEQDMQHLPGQLLGLSLLEVDDKFTEKHFSCLPPSIRYFECDFLSKKAQELVGKRNLLGEEVFVKLLENAFWKLKELH